MYITKEDLLLASSFGKFKAKDGDYKGVLTTMEAKQRLTEHSTQCGRGTVVTICSFKRGVWFYSDDHCFGHPVLPSDFVSSTTTIPHYAAPREGLEDGNVDSVDKYQLVYHRPDKGERQITSIEELIELLNKDL